MAADGSKAHEDNAADDVPPDQVLTLAIREKSFLQAGSNREVVNSESTGNHEISNAKDLHEVVKNGEVGSPQSRGMANKFGGKDNSVNNGNKSFAFGPRGQDNDFLKVYHIIIGCLKHFWSNYLVAIDFLFIYCRVHVLYCLFFLLYIHTYTFYLKSQFLLH